RAVGVVASLINPALQPAFSEANRQEQEALREQHKGRAAQRAILPLAEARRRRLEIEWAREEIPRPAFLGIRALDEFPMTELVPYIDWSPFFQAWELRGRYPAILVDE